MQQQKEFLFRFDIPFKEALRARGQGVEIILMFTWGVDRVYLLPETEWVEIVPMHIKEFWQVFYNEVGAWCEYNNVPLEVTAHGQSGVAIKLVVV
jgi:hypothetical protein